MSRFFVGQRVKKVRGEYNVGHEGVVLEIGVFDKDRSGRPFLERCTICVQYSKNWINVHGYVRSAAHAAYGKQEHFEPIVPDGMQPVEWEQCL